MSNQDRLRFSEAELSYVENTIELPVFSQVVDEPAQDFLAVRVTRHWAGPMATPLFGDVAVVFFLGAAAGAFLAELGKDIYRGLRAGLFTLYKNAKTWANNRGYAPFAIEQAAGGPDSAYHFTIPEGLDSKQFEDAIQSIPDALAGHVATNGLVGFVYDDGRWKLDEET